jgi:acyl-coenzyme A synthetase/AMP-(fatty) acid ligase
MNIADRLKRVCVTYPDRIAISQADRQITYRELRLKSLQIAAFIKQSGLQNCCIGIEVDDMANHIVTLIGVVISGNYYVSVTPDNKAFLADSSLPVALTIVSVKQTATQIEFDEILQHKTQRLGDDNNGLISDDSNMCAFFTSGSTGKSKVIIHRHKSILNDTLRQITDNEITGDDKLDLVFSLSFSASLACIFPAF